MAILEFARAESQESLPTRRVGQLMPQVQIVILHRTSVELAVRAAIHISEDKSETVSSSEVVLSPTASHH